MFVVISFPVAQTRNNPIVHNNKWINKLQKIHTIEYHSAKKKRKELSDDPQKNDVE